MGGVIAFRGLTDSLQTFTDPTRWKRTVTFIFGMAIVIFWKWPLLGMFFQGLALFQTFFGKDSTDLSTLLQPMFFVLKRFPVVGPFFTTLHQVKFK